MKAGLRNEKKVYEYNFRVASLFRLRSETPLFQYCAILPSPDLLNAHYPTKYTFTGRKLKGVSLTLSSI